MMTLEEAIVKCQEVVDKCPWPGTAEEHLQLLKWLEDYREMLIKPGQSRKFLEIVVEYHELCTYPEYEGKPYYAIKYEEKGEIIIGFGTYKPEVLSQYLRQYFLPSAEPERKTGKWCRHYTRPNVYEDLYWHCSACGYKCGEDYANVYYNYCPNCGARMEGE